MSMPDESTPHQTELFTETPAMKRQRSPLEKTFADLRGIEFDTKKLLNRFEDWQDKTSHPHINGYLQDSILDLQECLTRIHDVSEAFIRMRNLGFYGEDAK